jgi:hypothetical protein
VNWALDAALGTVAVIAGRRLLLLRFAVPPRSGGPGPVPGHQVTNSAAHLVMAAGMAAMAVPGGGPVPGPALRLGFGVLAVALVAGRFHHAVMFGIMALMAGPAHAVTSANTAAGPDAMPGMAMAQAGGGASPLLLAAFGYTCVFALVLGWRLPTAADAPGHACEIVMLVSTAVMLLPML